MIRRIILFTLFLLPAFSQAQVADALKEGRIFKVRVSDYGIHKISYADLETAGVNPSSLSPDRIQLFGNSGGILPQLTNELRPEGLFENAIKIVGGEDGSFDRDDYILFYAEGPDGLEFEASNDRFVHEKNFYSDYTYYFLKPEGEKGKRITSREDAGTGGSKDVNTFLDYLYLEEDEFNILGSIRNAPGGSGREWFSVKFDFETEHTFNFEMPGIVSRSPLILDVGVMAMSNTSSFFEIEFQNNKIAELDVASVPPGTYARRGNITEGSYRIDANGLANADELSVKLRYSKPDQASFGHLDFIRINAERELRFYGNQMRFRALESLTETGNLNFIFSETPSALEIWDITDPQNPLIQETQAQGAGLRFGVRAGSFNEFAAFDGTDFITPEITGEINNQYIRALEAPDMIIISADEFRAEADRLAEFRKQNDGLDVLVVSPEEIFNEFSSGRLDVSAMRDFVRVLYRKNPEKLRYLLLFGDTSYDFRDRLPNNTNFVPAYQSRETLNPIYSYSSEDYFGILEDGEGIWSETRGQNETLEIGIGRIPCRTEEQAKAVVDKLIHYEDRSSLGEWRNRIAFVADDGDQNTHQLDTEHLTDHIEETYKSYDIEKIYVDAFPQEQTNGLGRKSPVVRNLVSSTIERGVLIMNYTGHGAESGWSSEGIVTITQINDWDNMDRLAFLVTATCEFGRYDDPNQTSGGEYSILNPRGGAMGLVTTTRPVFSNTNFILAQAFYDMIFEPLADGSMPRLGDVIRRTKNRSLSVENRNFTLLGDPSARLAYPEHRLNITGITANGTSAETLSALDKVRVTGNLLDRSGRALTDYSGTLVAKVFDKPTEMRTLGDESDPMTFEMRENLLFSGEASLINGEWSFEFVVPKDMDYSPGTGKISLYAFSENNTEDANGFETEINVSGSNANAVPDNAPPQINLYLDELTFQDGDRVGSDPLLIAKLSDDSGINISGVGIGHEIIAFLDGDESQSFVLNEYFSAERDDYRKGTILFPFENLERGKHTLTLRAWDTHNNLGEATINFTVQDPAIQVSDLVVFPNPMTDETNFRFTHNRPGDDMEVVIHVFSASGQLVRNIRENFSNNDGEISGIKWDGTNNAGSYLPSGLYICRIFIHSADDGAITKTHKKITILR